MYSEKIKSIKYQPKEKERIKIGQSEKYTREQMKQIVAEFCTKDDLHYAEQAKLLDLFDEYCKENDYPLFNRKTAGIIISEVFGVKSKPVRINGVVKRIYI